MKVHERDEYIARFFSTQVGATALTAMLVAWSPTLGCLFAIAATVPMLHAVCPPSWAGTWRERATHFAWALPIVAVLVGSLAEQTNYNLG